MSNSIFTFAAIVANESGDSPHFFKHSKTNNKSTGKVDLYCTSWAIHFSPLYLTKSVNHFFVLVYMFWSKQPTFEIFWNDQLATFYRPFATTLVYTIQKSKPLIFGLTFLAFLRESSWLWIYSTLMGIKSWTVHTIQHVVAIIQQQK